MIRCSVDVVGRDPYYDDCGRLQWKETGRYSNRFDLETSQWALFTLNNIFGTAQTVKDVTGTNRSLSTFVTTSAYTIVAGTGSGTAAVTDYQLVTAVSGSSGSQTATIGSYSGSGSSGTYTVTATITNSSASQITYSEVGIEITASTYTFLVTHDFLSPTVPVSSNGTLNGTLQVTYTFTNE